MFVLKLIRHFCFVMAEDSELTAEEFEEIERLRQEVYSNKLELERLRAMRRTLEENDEIVKDEINQKRKTEKELEKIEIALERERDELKECIENQRSLADEQLKKHGAEIKRLELLINEENEGENHDVVIEELMKETEMSTDVENELSLIIRNLNIENEELMSEHESLTELVGCKKAEQERLKDIERNSMEIIKELRKERNELLEEITKSKTRPRSLEARGNSKFGEVEKKTADLKKKYDYMRGKFMELHNDYCEVQASLAKAKEENMSSLLKEKSPSYNIDLSVKDLLDQMKATLECFKEVFKLPPPLNINVLGSESSVRELQWMPRSIDLYRNEIRQHSEKYISGVEEFITLLQDHSLLEMELIDKQYQLDKSRDLLRALHQKKDSLIKG